MPEGPEVHRAARRLARVLVDRPLEAVHFLHPKIAAHGPRLASRTITAVQSRGKAFLLRFGSKGTLYVHLQLYGRWQIHRRATQPRSRRTLRVALCTAQHQALLYSATELEVLSDAGIARHPYLSRLGPDLLDPNLTTDVVTARLLDAAWSGRALASLLLDQGFIAGVGNYLRAEMLFSAGVHPRRRPRDLHIDEVEAVAASVLQIGRRALDQSGTTTDPELHALAERRGWSPRRVRHYIFARDGQACFVCGHGVERANLGGRRMYWCPSCQR